MQSWHSSDSEDVICGSDFVGGLTNNNRFIVLKKTLVKEGQEQLLYAEIFRIVWINKCFLNEGIANQIKMHFRKIKHRRDEVYISEPIDCDAEGNSLTIEDIYSSDVNIEQAVELKINSEKLYSFIEEELDSREREIICKRYGIADKNGKITKPMTQREIAKKMGISRSYISRIEKKALEKLRARFEQV